MNNLKLKFYNDLKQNLCVFIDDKPFRLRGGNKDTKFSTEKNSIKLRVCKINTFHKKHWFIYQMFLFLIRIFGIFKTKKDKKFWVFDYEYELTLGENTTFELLYEFQKDGTRKVIAKSNTEYKEISGTCYVDEEAKSKNKKLILPKILTIIAFIVASILLLVLLL